MGYFSSYESWYPTQITNLNSNTYTLRSIHGQFLTAFQNGTVSTTDKNITNKEQT